MEKIFDKHNLIVVERKGSRKNGANHWPSVIIVKLFHHQAFPVHRSYHVIRL